MSHALSHRADHPSTRSMSRLFIEALENRTMFSMTIATPLPRVVVTSTATVPKATHRVAHKAVHKKAKQTKAIGLAKTKAFITAAPAAVSTASQNVPVLTSAVSTGSTTTVIGSISSTADKTITIDFYSSPTNGLQSTTYLGSETVTTDSSGNAVINADLAAAPTGDYIAATATITAMCSASETSGFSAPVLDTSSATGSTTGSTPDPSGPNMWIAWDNQGAANRYILVA